jgi:very-short-patch-repair endonuclease
MSDLFAFLVALMVFLVAVLALATKLRGIRTLPVKGRPLMTAREREVISMIETAVPHCRVHAQVAMAAIVDCNGGLTRAQRASIRNRFDRKIVDFVLEDKSSGNVLAIVELDDRTHSATRDRARDEITRAAGHRTIRLPAGKRPNHTNVRSEILSGLAGLTSPRAAYDSRQL